MYKRQFYARAVAVGVISPSLVLPLADTEDCWEALNAGRVGMAAVGSRRFWTSQSATLAPAPLPTRSGRAVTLTRGWVVAVVTDDPRRQARAMEWLAWMMAPEGYGLWTQSAGYLPSTRGGLAAWSVDEADRAVLEALLEGAHAAPPQSLRDAIGPPLREAVEAVLTGQRTPAEAARRAVESLHP